MKFQPYRLYMLTLALAEVPPLVQILLRGADATQVSPWFDPANPEHRGRPLTLAYAGLLGALCASRVAVVWRPRSWLAALQSAAAHTGELALLAALVAQQAPEVRAREGTGRTVRAMLAAVAANAVVTLACLRFLARGGSEESEEAPQKK